MNPPSFQEMLKPLLAFSSGVETFSIGQAIEEMIKIFNLTPKTIAIRTKKGSMPRVEANAREAITHLYESGLFFRKKDERKSLYGITERGKRFISINEEKDISMKDLQRFLSYRYYRNINNVKLVFAKIAWMKQYNGMLDDKISQNYGFPKEKGFGHEMFNFKGCQDGFTYGYIPEPITRKINITRLGAKEENDFIDNVLVIWVSSRKLDEGMVNFIVGWYINATMYSTIQNADGLSERKYKNDYIGYQVKTENKNCFMIPEEDRVQRVPGKKDGGMGQTKVWYAERPEHKNAVKSILKYIDDMHFHIEYENPTESHGQVKKGSVVDQERKVQVEKSAINKTTSYFEDLGFVVESVEGDNVGWDLEAKKDGKLLFRIEVKGLSGEDIKVELTPNEYANMNKFISNYQLCVVSRALSDMPILKVFSYDENKDEWNDRVSGKKLRFERIESARLFIE